MFAFIEAPFFTKSIDRCLDDDEYLELQSHLIRHPETGEVVPASGGVRKLRKNVNEGIPAHVLKSMKEAIEDEKDD